MVFGGIVPFVLNLFGIIMDMILGFKPLRIYDLTNENLLIALPSGFMSFVPIFFALLFQTLVPTAL